MTPKEYAEVKLAILKLVVGFGMPIELRKAEEVFEWVIHIPEHALMRVDP